MWFVANAMLCKFNIHNTFRNYRAVGHSLGTMANNGAKFTRLSRI